MPYLRLRNVERWALNQAIAFRRSRTWSLQCDAGLGGMRAAIVSSLANIRAISDRKAWACFGLQVAKCAEIAARTMTASQRGSGSSFGSTIPTVKAPSFTTHKHNFGFTITQAVRPCVAGFWAQTQIGEGV